MTDTATQQATTTPSTSPESATLSENALAPKPPVNGSVKAQASLSQRAGAYLIDMGVAIAIVVVISLTISMMLPKLGMLLSLAGAAYILLRDALPFLGGQSIGKKMLGLRAVTTDGNSLSGNWNPGLVRNVVLFIPFFAIVEAIILFTKQDAPEGLIRLGDQWAGTKVIIEK